MKIARVNMKEQEMTLVPQVLDDLWHLEKVIEKGDLVSGSTDRKIKGKEEGEKAKRIAMNLQIRVQNVEFQRHSESLRINGTIEYGSPAELVELHAFHSLEAELGKPLRVKKEQWKAYQVDRLRKAEQSMKKPKVLLCVLDDEQADFAELSDYGLQEKFRVQGFKTGKRMHGEGSVEKYYQELFEKIKESPLKKTVVAGPGFTKNNLQKWLEKTHKMEQLQREKTLVFESLNSTGTTGMHELLTQGIIERTIHEMEIAKDAKLIEKILEELGKNRGLIAYGIQDVREALEMGAVEELLLTDKLLAENKKEAEALLDLAESTHANAHILASEHDPGKQLDGLSGVGALLRFKIR
ncbi:MAG: mRNA surveillance protein pelota [Candidatus Diapherotrites archaeon]|nr:mRNA surveillance protein pelota [Candidatus Diapherotrites archaeon]